MSMSACYSTYYRVDSLGIVTDVASIITGLRAALTVSPPAASRWTEPAAGTFKSPARADGMFFTVTPTKISATRIAYVVRDHYGLLVNNATDTRQDIDTPAGTTIVIYSGPMHLVVNSGRTTPEAWCCGMMERSPDLNSVPRGLYFASYGPRNTAGSLSGNEWGCYWVWSPNTGLYVGSNQRAYCLAYRQPAQSGLYSSDRFTIAGDLINFTLEFICVNWWMGRFPQAIITDQSRAYGESVRCPIDDAGTVGTFQVVGFPPDVYQYTRAKLAIRTG